MSEQVNNNLNDMQRLFVTEYLIDLNATQAAIRAGYSEKTAMEQGSRLLRNVKIKEAIQIAMDERVKRTEVTQDRVLKELAKIGFADLKDFLRYGTEKVRIDTDNDGNPVYDYKQTVEAKSSDEVDGTLVSEVSIGKDGTFKFKLHDKMAALDKMGKHLGLFNDKEVSTNDIKSDIDRAILALLTTKQPAQQPKPDETDETQPIISN